MYRTANGRRWKLTNSHRISRKLAAFAVLGATVAAGIATLNARAADTTKELRFGVEASYAPFESKSPSGELMGFDIDIGNAVCAKLKVKCVWVENSFDGLIPALQARKFDGINSDMTITDKRKLAINFTDPIYTIPNQLIAKKGSTVQPTVDGLKGKRVGVLQSSIQETYTKAKWAPTGIDVESYQAQDQIYADLASGRLDAAFQDAEVASKGFLKQPQGAGFAFAGPAVTDDKLLGSGVGFGVRKNDKALKEALNRALKELKDDRTIDRFAAKYFDVKVVLK
ncbi:Lysine-arginine-ornithine-binding periplasmic protein precursor [Candidatus Paraburkholderia kirkii]|nr:Lysine-arginine-ornithine-binding periplasmic protein precursor [Candidatus Paraburkholderia kirkii]